MTKLVFTNKVLPTFTLSLVIATIGVAIGNYYLSFLLQSGVLLVLTVLEFVLLIGSFFAKRNKQASAALVFGFVFLSGLVISPLIAEYIQTGYQTLVFQAFGITTVTFGSLSAYAYYTRQNFSRLRGILFVGLIGLIFSSLLNIFLQNGSLFFIINIVSVLIFSGYVLFDMDNILTNYSDDDVYPAVLALYIDFLNLFINILELLGIFERRKN